MAEIFRSFWSVPLSALALIIGSIFLTYALSNLPPWPYTGGPIPGEMAFISSEKRVEIEAIMKELSALNLDHEINQKIEEVPTLLFQLSQQILEADREYTIESVNPKGGFDWSYLQEPKIALTVLGMIGSAIVFLVGTYFSVTSKQRADARHQLELQKLELEISALRRSED